MNPIRTALTAKLPDPLRCRVKRPAAELDRVVRENRWFEFGFRSGRSLVSFSYAAAKDTVDCGSGARSDLLVSRVSTVGKSGALTHTSGPSGRGPFSELVAELGAAPPDLRTIWVSFDERAPEPKPFAELVGAALMDLVGAKAVPLEQDGPLDLAQRALGSDNDFDAVVPLDRQREIRMESAGCTTLRLHAPGRRPRLALTLEDAIIELANKHAGAIDVQRVQLRTSTRNNRKLGTGAWVDRKTLRALLVAAFVDAIQRR